MKAHEKLVATLIRETEAGKVVRANMREEEKKRKTGGNLFS